MSSKSIYCSCSHCREVVTTAQIGKHYKSKSCLNGGKYKHKTHCRYCNEPLDLFSDKANHVRWCNDNPNRAKNIQNLEYARNCKTEESFAKAAAGISAAHRAGKYVNARGKSKLTYIKNNSRPTKESNPSWYTNVTEANRKAKHQRVCKRTHKFIDKNNREFMFDSSWEDALAIRLDELNISWIRPEPISYELNNKSKLYFPDFFLPEYNLYLDPKNEYTHQQQREKLEIVFKLINLKILNSLEECQSFNI